MKTTPTTGGETQAAEAARLAEELREAMDSFGAACHNAGQHTGTDYMTLPSRRAAHTAIDRLRDLASRADSPVGEAADALRQARPIVSAMAHRDRQEFGSPTTHTTKVLAAIDQALAASPAVEAKPTAAEVTGDASEGVCVKCGAYPSGPCPMPDPDECIQREEPDVPDIIAGELQCSRAYAYTLMERALAERYPRASPSASTGEAQKAVAWQWRLSPNDPWIEYWGTEEGALELQEDGRWEVRPLYTHPSAGAGVPQEVARLTEAEVDALMVLADEYASWKAAHVEHATPGSLSNMNAARETLRAALKGKGA